ncbi:MAG: hypothetical protein U0610_31310 [bacterium]
MKAGRLGLGGRWAVGALLVLGATAAAAQEAEQRRLIHTRVVHASVTAPSREVWVDPSLRLISTKLTSQFPYRRYTLLQDVTQSLGVDEMGSIVLPADGGSVEVRPIAFDGKRTRMVVRLVPARADLGNRAVQIKAETSPRGTVVIGGMPHPNGTLLILIQQHEALPAGSAASRVFGASPQY